MKRCGRLEEERRLAYVGVTRAMQKLTLTYAETRRLFGKEVYLYRPSRFIGELPRPGGRGTPARDGEPSGQPSADGDADGGKRYWLQTGGQRVRHPKFGEGTIVNRRKRRA